MDVPFLSTATITLVSDTIYYSNRFSCKTLSRINFVIRKRTLLVTFREQHCRVRVQKLGKQFQRYIPSTFTRLVRLNFYGDFRGNADSFTRE